MSNKEKILSYLGAKGLVTIRDIAERLDISLSMTHRHLKTLLKDGAVRKIGKAPKVTYASVQAQAEKIDTVVYRSEHTVFGPPHAVFNLSKMGLRYFRIGIDAAPSSRDALVKHFAGHPNVGWIFSAEGWFNLAVGIWAKDNAEIDDISSQIRKVLGRNDRIVFQSELTSLFGFGNRPVVGGDNALRIVDATTDAIDLAPIEIDYVKLIALDSSLSYKGLGKILGIDAVQVRVMQEKLTEQGVIVGFQERIDYGGLYYKVFIDSLSGETKEAADSLVRSLWNDPACIYIARANSKYDVEFEVILKDASQIDTYLESFSEYKTSVLNKSLYTNLYPLNKVANFKNIGDVLQDQQGSVVDLRDSKLWYLNYQGAESYLNIYENREYFEVMEQGELDLFDDVTGFIKERYPKELFSVTDIGSGNGLKGKVFIEKLGEKSVKAYYPIDIQPIELEAALAAHADGAYSKHPTLLDIENLSARFPLPALPNERQLHMFFGGTYGNFRSKEINGYLKSLVNETSSLVVAMPIVGGIKTDKEIADSYANMMAENTAFGTLAQLGFVKDDFEQNPQYPNLKVHIAMEDRRNILSFVLKRDVEVFERVFAKGTVFKVTTSWKPTLDEFRAALEEDFVIEKMFRNQSMALAIVSGLAEGR